MKRLVYYHTTKHTLINLSITCTYMPTCCADTLEFKESGTNGLFINMYTQQRSISFKKTRDI